MDTTVIILLTALVAYLVGGIPFGYLIARARGVNIFEQGSGNIGATNVGRVLGRRFGILVFLLDFAKGAVPTALVLHLLPLRELAECRVEVAIVAGLAAFIGHLFPIYLAFRGGKGVATAAGVVTILVPVPLLLALLVWLGMVAATRYVSLASLAAALALCSARVLLTPTPFASNEWILTLFCLILAAFVFVRHHSNIRRLLRAQENQLEDRPAMNQLLRIVHVLTLGLWFGSAVFFTFVVGLSLFGNFEKLALQEERPRWFPRPPLYEVKDEFIDGSKEQGSRAAGFAVSPMFPSYFALQGVCGFLALATAWRWQSTHPEQRLHRWRVTVLILALLTVILGWPLEQYVSDLRGPRHATTERYLETRSEADRHAALAARREFGLWHTVSLFLNFGTIALVGVALGMGATLPENRSSPESTQKREGE